MLVKSRVKFESDRKAVAAPLSQVIGNIQTAIGDGTLRRADGTAAQAIVGDPVCHGDVIETAADGRIGIRFIDGTVFNLSCSTCVVLNEFVCDSTGTSHSALFGVTKGAFAFIAGRLASQSCHVGVALNASPSYVLGYLDQTFSAGKPRAASANCIFDLMA